MVTMTPYLRESQFKDEAKRCVEELGFVGIKLHPMAMAASPMSRVGAMMWETCAALDVPIMVHTGAGVPFALPSLCIQRAKEFPEVPCILAHCGMLVFFAETVLAAGECDNIFMETSWTAPHHIRELVEKYGSGRVMFGSDEDDNIAP
jgi:predicted TIM-barrel fold metal-dependent hydrolase